MKIYTVIPFFSDDEVSLNDVKSFKSISEAEMYAWNSIDGKTFTIAKNELS